MHILHIDNLNMPATKNLLLISVALTSSYASALVPGHSKNYSKVKNNLKLPVIRDLTTSTPEFSSRRDVFRSMTGIVFGVATAVVSRTEEADASYTAYTQREEDWEARKKTGDISFSSSQSLKAQLREIAPMNNASSKIFCPNGPSSAVSPLMENKCNDVQAAPSVFGRTTDVSGNSIPGAANGRVSPSVPGGTSSLNAEVGFPAYYKK